MTEKNKQKIEECIKNKTTNLRLSDLDSIPKEISKLTWLTELNFINCQILKIENLDKLTKLKILFLFDCQISKIENLDKLFNLHTLVISGNQISKIENLDKLTNLHSLFLHNNQISKIENLDKLTNLKLLDLDNNEISKIENLNELINLYTLDIRNNQISKIENLDKLINLRILYLHKNEISKIENLNKLINLYTLYLSGNQIPKIENLGKLFNLESLYLQNNQISKIETLDKLVNLKVLELENNQLSDISKNYEINSIPVVNLNNNQISSLNLINEEILSGTKKVYWNNVETQYEHEKENDNNFIKVDVQYFQKGFYIKECNKLKCPPVDWAHLGPEVVQSYFQAIAEQGEEEMNEVKVILIGDGGAGKTSLAHRLAYPEKPLPKKTDRTRGVDVYPWEFKYNGKKYKANIWDFGGQTVYEAVHQYFFSNRALYILVEETRGGSNTTLDSRRDWFLQSANAFGKGSPMIYIQNEYEGFSKNIPYDSLREHYPFLEKNYYTTNLKSKTNLPKVIRAIQERIVELDSVGMILPKKWLAVRDEIDIKRKEGEDIISLDDFRAICIDKDIIDHDAQTKLANYFHQLGVFLHYSDKNYIGLNEKIIINRNWATKATYQVYDDETIKKSDPKGRFNTDDIARLWNEAEFKNHKADILLLMNAFKICFKLDKTNEYLVPRLMGNMPVGKDFCPSKNDEEPFYFYFKYDFMPEGIVNNLSVTKHDLIAGNKKEFVWSDGVVFEHKRKKLLAEIREHRLGGQQRIDIRITGKDIPFMADTIIDELEKINESLNRKRLKIEVKTPCICTKCKAAPDKEKEYYSYHQLKEWLTEPHPNNHQLQCRSSWQQVSMHELLKVLSHKAIKEVDEKQKQNQVGKYADKLADGLAGIMTHSIKKEHIKTRKTIEEKSDKLEAQIAEIPIIFRQNLAETEKNLIASIFNRLNQVDLNIENAKDLIEIIGSGIDELFRKQPTQEDLLKAFQEVTIQNSKDDFDLKEKLKITLPLIPTILKYEMELSSDSIRKQLHSWWKEGGWKRLFVEDVE